MIFISGIHAVGKGYFCGLVKKELGIEAYSASDLIAKARNAGFSSDKLVADIEENQQYLLAAVQELRESGTDFILDGELNNACTNPDKMTILNQKGKSRPIFVIPANESREIAKHVLSATKDVQ